MLPDQTAIDRNLVEVRQWLKEDRVSPVISVALGLWEWSAMPRRAEAKEMVAQGIERLEPTMAYLAGMAKETR